MCNLGPEECGKHSGIPPCCREFFTKVWSPFMMGPSRPPFVVFPFPNKRENAIHWRTASAFIEIRSFGYILCPGSRAVRANVIVKDCPTLGPKKRDGTL